MPASDVGVPSPYASPPPRGYPGVGYHPPPWLAPPYGAKQFVIEQNGTDTIAAGTITERYPLLVPAWGDTPANSRVPKGYRAEIVWDWWHMLTENGHNVTATSWISLLINGKASVPGRHQVMPESARGYTEAAAGGEQVQYIRPLTPLLVPVHLEQGDQIGYRARNGMTAAANLHFRITGWYYPVPDTFQGARGTRSP